METNKESDLHSLDEQSLIKEINSNPNNLDAIINLCNLYLKQDKNKQAIQVLFKASKIHKDYLEINKLLGQLLMQEDSSKLAISYLQKWSELDPKSDSAHITLGHAHTRIKQFSESIPVFKKAIKLNNKLDDAYMQLAIALSFQGFHKEAEINMRKAIALNPKNKFWSNLFFTLIHQDKLNPIKIYEESIAWGKSITKLVNNNYQFSNKKDPNKRLKVGYVSSHFKLHSGAYTTLPLFKNHSIDNFEIFCYNDDSYADAITVEHKKYINNWIEAEGWDAKKLSDKIKEDEIDILIDLHGHSGVNRMSLFAMRSAPIQINWLGHLFTTGLPTIDNRIVDYVTDPDTDFFNKQASEILIRMPNCLLCYDPLRPTPSVSKLPTIQNGIFTFGSFNNYNKITDTTMRLWSNVLKAVPESRLLLKNQSFGDPVIQKLCLNRFEEFGIDRKRIFLKSSTASFMQHLNLYGQVDLGLDPYPYQGAITSCESVWMGVPVITLQGQHHTARICSSVLTAAGLEEFVAKDEEEYVAIAKQWADNIDKLAKLRNGMREQVKNSPLNNVAQFTKDLEKVYRELWRNWCKIS